MAGGQPLLPPHFEAVAQLNPALGGPQTGAAE
jgi:hypothetical protein